MLYKKWMCFWFRKNTSFMYKTFENSVWKEESKLDLVVPKVHFSSWLFYLRNCFFQYTTCTSLLYLSLYLFILGGCGSKNFENWLNRWRKIGFPRGSRHDEKIWSQEYRQTFGSLYPKRTYLYRNGIHVIRRLENLSLSQVIVDCGLWVLWVLFTLCDIL